MRVFPVTWQQWRSQSHNSIRHSQKPHATSTFTPLFSTEPELLPTKVLHCRIMEFRTFCSCDLDLDPMTFIYEHDPYLLKISPQYKNKHSTSGFSKIIVLQTDRHTDMLLKAQKLLLWQRENWTHVVGSSICQQVDGLGLSILEGKLEGGQGVGGTVTGQLVDPRPGAAKARLGHVDDAWLPWPHVRVERHDVHLLFVTQLLLRLVHASVSSFKLKFHWDQFPRNFPVTSP